MATLQDAIEAIQDVALTLSGVKEAPDYPTEAMNQFPFVVTYAASGTWERESDWKKGLHTIFAEIHVSRELLPRAIAQTMPYAETFPNALLNDPTLNGTVDTIVGEIRYTFGRLSLGGNQDEHIGFRFEIQVKQQNGIT